MRDELKLKLIKLIVAIDSVSCEKDITITLQDVRDILELQKGISNVQKEILLVVVSLLLNDKGQCKAVIDVNDKLQIINRILGNY
jgi:hypothetical protein